MDDFGKCEVVCNMQQSGRFKSRIKLWKCTCFYAWKDQYLCVGSVPMKFRSEQSHSEGVSLNHQVIHTIIRELKDSEFASEWSNCSTASSRCRDVQIYDKSDQIPTRPDVPGFSATPIGQEPSKDDVSQPLVRQLVRKTD